MWPIETKVVVTSTATLTPVHNIDQLINDVIRDITASHIIGLVLLDLLDL